MSFKSHSAIAFRLYGLYRAIILPGVTIGNGAVVGAGSVVTKDMEAFTIVADYPARLIKKSNPNLQYQFNYQSWLM